MQKVSFTPATPRFDAEDVIHRINLLADIFRKNDNPIIFIQHDGTKEGICIPNTESWEILDALKVDRTDLIISKTANDAFYQTELEAKLSEMKVDELVITGCATDFCVDATLKSALVHDFNITVIADGHTTADRPHLEAKRVIAYYNWIWSEMTPTNGKITVTQLDDYLNEADKAIE